MRTGSPKSALVVIIAIFLLDAVVGCKSNGTGIANTWPLERGDILLELRADGKGNPAYPPGVYAINPGSSKRTPRLLVKGAERPVWRPQRDGFAFLKQGGVWVAASNGKSLVVARGVSSHLLGDQPPLYWTLDGQYLLSIYDYSNGTTILASRSFTMTPHPREVYAVDDLPPQTWLLGKGTPQELYAENGWKDIISAKSATVAPDGQSIALEISPLAPRDILRSRSKIYVLRGWGRSGHPSQARSLLFCQNQLNDARRLTKSGDSICELDPLWSPDGRWIAFTVVNCDQGYVVPVVCRPDGSQYTELLPRKTGELAQSDPQATSWSPVAPVDPAYKPEAVSPESGWGTPNVRVAEWSDDGSCLLLNRGSVGCVSSEIAKYKDGKWLLNDLGGTLGRGSIAIGPSKSSSCTVAICDPLLRDSISVLDKEEERQRIRVCIKMPPGVAVEWLDW